MRTRLRHLRWDLAMRREKFAERFWQALAARLPKRVKYWSLIAAGVGVIGPNEEVPAVPFTEVLRRNGQRWMGNG